MKYSILVLIVFILFLVACSSNKVSNIKDIYEYKDSMIGKDVILNERTALHFESASASGGAGFSLVLRSKNEPQEIFYGKQDLFLINNNQFVYYSSGSDDSSFRYGNNKVGSIDLINNQTYQIKGKILICPNYSDRLCLDITTVE